MPAASRLRAWQARRPPAAGAAVMATGILSLGLHLTGAAWLSVVFLALACAGWLAMACDFAVRLLRDRSRWAAEAGTPGALTAVAATAVLGTRFSVLGAQTLAAALLALAAALWPVLLVPVLRGCRRPMPGSVFLCCVATEGPAVLGVTLATAVSATWLVHAALVLFWLGLALYVLALSCFDRRQVVEGPGDQWVAGGALAISALAGAELTAVGSGPVYLWSDDDSGVLRSVTIGLVVLDLCWFAVLLVSEVVRPRLRYDVRRWSTVFPLGMSATAALTVAAALDIRWLAGWGRVLLWIAVAVWLAVAVGAVRQACEELDWLRRPEGLRSTARR
ncbi:tellurite resistance/C4-dicarboxylate transporter family protein [Streptomyces sp. NPDC004065]|uniref:tellurite resistance/C4-dicarboxylate transporter family protein n=1 Tax=Streptomyces sp. NPDC004065 TaxID=3364689 RepID=UPI0038503E62